MAVVKFWHPQVALYLKSLFLLSSKTYWINLVNIYSHSKVINFDMCHIHTYVCVYVYTEHGTGVLLEVGTETG